MTAIGAMRKGPIVRSVLACGGKVELSGFEQS